MATKQPDVPAGHIGREQLLEHGQRGAWLAAEARHPSVAGIESRIGTRGRRECAALPIVLADRCSECEITSRPANGLDPLVFIRRHGLLRELPADPVGLFRHDHAQAAPRRRQCRRAAAESTANDHEVGAQLLRRGKMLHALHERARCERRGKREANQGVAAGDHER